MDDDKDNLREPVIKVVIGGVSAAEATTTIDADRARRAVQLMDKIEFNMDRIYVREKIDSKFESYSLAELPGSLAIKHAFRFLREAMEK